MSAQKSTNVDAAPQHVEDMEKDLYSLQSGSTVNGMCTFPLPVSFPIESRDLVAPRGIDAEVAQFFAQHGTNASNPIVIDEATNKRLRRMVDKRVLVSSLVLSRKFQSFILVQDRHGRNLL